jgi:hypothetical protein
VAGLNGVPDEQVEYDLYDRPVLFKPIHASRAPGGEGDILAEQ